MTEKWKLKTKITENLIITLAMRNKKETKKLKSNKEETLKHKEKHARIC